MRRLMFFLLILVSPALHSQVMRCVTIFDRSSSEPIAAATVIAGDSIEPLVADANGKICLPQQTAKLRLTVSATGYKAVTIDWPQNNNSTIYMDRSDGNLGEVVVTGTMREVKRIASPVPVEVYTPKFFLKNPTPSIFDALQMVNGIRPQLNCNVCNTGDIHINGLEGPYTMILIDGMPIVSSLASVYGLSGIPNSIVERIEVVKGPASSLYGSEAIGGLINVITRNPSKAPLVSADISGTSWQELNADLAFKTRFGRRVTSLTGINYFNYSNPVDNNNDNFTDITLQKRISVFNRLSWQRKENRLASVALRYVYEDRWGGEMNWTKQFRGTDSVYGENIYTSRAELIGNYQLPVREKLLFAYSANLHQQNSAYGTTIFNADQNVLFGQLTYEKDLGKHALLAGAVGRYTFYDDNTTATVDTLTLANKADKVFLPGVFVQDDISVAPNHQLLIGARYDYDKRHGNIFTPRIAYKISVNENNIIRLNAGTGFRVVNLFTEDHAALTGARAVEIRSELEPERSYNVNLNVIRKIYSSAWWLHLELTGWYTHFTNRIIPDYTTDANKIIYDNLSGYSVSKGVSLSAEAGFTNSLRATLGITLMDVSVTDAGNHEKRKSRQLLTENWTGTWTVSYSLPKSWSIDYTGSIYGPMLLPVVSDLDPRRKQSPVWSIQNIQVTKRLNKNIEFYGGVKNLLNWTPAKNNPFLIARAHDPFDKKVEFGSNGQPVATAENPYALTFDPNYVYAPNQGIRAFAGVRLQLTQR
jgi:outer membrane receptor for ferrienterochelin and colicins